MKNILENNLGSSMVYPNYKTLWKYVNSLLGDLKNIKTVDKFLKSPGKPPSINISGLQFFLGIIVSYFINVFMNTPPHSKKIEIY